MGVPGNGALGNPGYQDLAIFDAREQMIIMTNSTIMLGKDSFGVASIDIDANGNVDLLGGNVTIGGNVAGFFFEEEISAISAAVRAMALIDAGEPPASQRVELCVRNLPI